MESSGKFAGESKLALYAQKKQQLQAAYTKLASSGSTPYFKKKTASNLFRYQSLQRYKKSFISLEAFNDILLVDPIQQVLEVEGLATYNSIVSHTLPYGLMPTVTPELKQITIGGAIVGIGIESTGFRQGFVHDGLLEAEVLLPDGQVVVCNPHNAHADLFNALPNSYGTLGYILRAKIRLISALPYVHLRIQRFRDIDAFLSGMHSETQNDQNEFIEGLFYSKDELYLMVGRLVAQVPYEDDIYRKSIFYKLCREKNDIYLSTQDYIFRYDPDWFWNIPDSPFYNFLRWICPRSWRNSGLYKKYLDLKRRWMDRLPFAAACQAAASEMFIQDWEVPWPRAKELIEYALENVDLAGNPSAIPWAAVPIKPSRTALLYPMQDCSLYFNLGAYAYAKRRAGSDAFQCTKQMDQECFRLGGIKMLYSSTFLSAAQLASLYNGAAYRLLKQKYDPHKRLPDLYEEAVKR